MVLVNCLNMTCQNAARMTMLEKGTCLQWRPLVYSDMPTIEVISKTWKILNKLLGKNHDKSNPQIFNINNSQTKDKSKKVTHSVIFD